MDRDLAMASAAIARTQRQFQQPSPARLPARTGRTLPSPSAPLSCPDTGSPSVIGWLLTVPSGVNLPFVRRVLNLTQCPQHPQTAKDEPMSMITTTRRRPVNDAGHGAGPACPDGRLLALQCLGIPQVATRAAMSRRRRLLRGLAAFCARLRPRNTAELASLVLYLGEEIDRRERMLDAALRAMVTVPGERALGSPAASRPPARAGQPDQISEPATV
jgi:hypothetical protein